MRLCARTNATSPPRHLRQRHRALGLAERILGPLGAQWFYEGESLGYRAPNCIAGGRGLTQSPARASSPRATGGRFVESRRATNGFHTRSDARAPIDACGPSKSPILPELCRTHLGLLDARAEFEPGILVLLQCGALRRPALPGMQSREHEPKRLQGPRCEMQHKRQRHFAFVLRRWLTWFYPQVCQNQALSGASTFLFCPSMSATASADC